MSVPSSAGDVAFSDAVTLAQRLQTRISEFIYGQESVVTETLCCLFSGGHILMTGAPGLAKTTLVRVISQSLGLNFGRVQFTPDLLPSDILGSDILNLDPESGRRSFEFVKGPIFVNLLLADEINRASPRTQSALLEAMQERSITVGGKSHRLALPFMVFATQNPFESEGTFPLPEAQLDRFLIHSLVDYPSAEAEEKLLKVHSQNHLIGENFSNEKPAPILDSNEVQSLIERAKSIRIDEEIIRGISVLVRSSRPEDPSFPTTQKNLVKYGAGPRAGISLVSVCRSLALLEGSEVVRWSHVRRLAGPILRHRLRMTAGARRDGIGEDQFIQTLLERTESSFKNLAKGIS